ncbi:MAG: 16S rRNA (cytosine(1402)-N(4))-methyltransferase RsmH [Anaerolineaceae bacterium]
MSQIPAPHISVLYHNIIESLRPTTPGHYVDATVGAGGHAWGILNSSSPGGTLLGFDLDPHALELAEERLQSFSGRYTLLHTSYTTLLETLKQQNWGLVNGIVIDLGVSSMQIDNPERGFSFMKEGPLDMRFDPTQTTTAADLVNTLSEEDLADILFVYGEERLSRRIARAIVANRPFKTTSQLASLIQKSIGRSSGKIHPATRSFQALRIAVNGELKSLESFLPQAVSALTPGGRLAVISFHSLEDRIVKQFFRKESSDCICPPDQPVCTCGHKASIKEITRHPLTATDDEIAANPRARSARLRVAEKIEKAVIGKND